MVSKEIKKSVQDDIETLERMGENYCRNKESSPMFERVKRSVVLAIWPSSMLPLTIWYMGHTQQLREYTGTAIKAFLGLGMFNLTLTFILGILALRGVNVFVEFKCYLKEKLNLGETIDYFVKRSALVACLSFFFTSLTISFLFDVQLILNAWFIALIPTLVLTRAFSFVESRRLGIAPIIKGLKRMIKPKGRVKFLKFAPYFI
jgi:hypothetical protein